ncbi:MAG: hypothetical protein A2Y38_26185 [Spirochaetes bacterium GWB1_59_5]|nr:MAG: hypothetical protein A2Y38_26185 [Spirochaetes bacterium GWB1_59_5]
MAVVALTFAVNYGLDRLTKLLATAYLQGKRGFSFLYDTVVLRYAENSGAFLSMGSRWPDWLKYAVLLVLPTLLCLYGLYYCLFKERDLWKTIFLVSALAGGLGNLIDRSFNDFMVVDFLNFGIGRLRTGVLNVADLSITFGFLAYLIREWALRPRED